MICGVNVISDDSMSNLSFFLNVALDRIRSYDAICYFLFRYTCIQTVYLSIYRNILYQNYNQIINQIKLLSK